MFFKSSDVITSYIPLLFTSDGYSYFMNGQPLPTVMFNVEKDLGAYVDNQLKFHHQTAAVITRANHILKY